MVKVKTILIAGILLATPFFVAGQTIGQEVVFNIDSSYDLYGRQEVEAQLIRTAPNLYFYVEKLWWETRSSQEQNDIRIAIFELGEEFKNKIYPVLTTNFGSEPKPGIDKDERITVLIHPMISDAGGYFNSGDGYPKIQNPKSNEREMVYLNAQYAGEDILKSLLAHEFSHLIILNQKDILRNVSEEIWLAEARADYAPTLLGYDSEFKGSNLERRVKEFLRSSNNPLTEWKNESADYGVINLFTQYLVGHYGINILADSLKSSKVGIPSINEALAKNGFKEDFSKIFTDWLITVLVNDCNLSEKYCYKNPNLKNLRISPQINFLPLTGETILTVYNTTKNWAGNWQKIVGGKGVLTLEFDGADEVNFKVPYLICDYQNQCPVNSLILDEKQTGKITLTDFNKKYTSLIIIPSIQSKTLGFDGTEISYPFSVKITTSEKTEEENEAELKEQLLAQIDFLQKEIARVQAQINEILGKKPVTPITEIPAGFKFEKNLSAGITDSDVVYLKIILAAEGCVSNLANTDLFGQKTLAGVKCFQTKYQDEISAAAGYPIQVSGFVGKGTRTKLNQLIK